MLKARGVDVVFRLHQQRKIDFRCGRRLGREDHIVSWPRPGRPGWMDESTYEQIPETLEIRELRVRVTRRGFRTRVINVVTTLLDVGIYRKSDLESLYRERWHAELDLRLDQDSLGNGRTAMQDTRDGPQGDRHDVGGVQDDPRAPMARAAKVHERRPRRLSFKGREPLLGFAGELRYSSPESATGCGASFWRVLPRTRSKPSQPNRAASQDRNDDRSLIRF